MERAPTSIRFGEFVVDPADRRLLGPQGEVRLGGKAFDVLETLLQAEGRLVTKDQLFEIVWDGRAVSDAALTSVIRDLRLALGQQKRNGMIMAVYGQGYRLKAEIICSDGGTHPLARTSPAGADSRPTLAVLPFDDLSADGNMRFFSDGISDEIQCAVARGSDIRTIGKLSSFAYRDGDKARAPIELPVSHILDGSVRQMGNHVRITVQLSDVASGVTLWNEVYEHDRQDLIDTQIAIAAMVAKRLEQEFRPVSGTEISEELYNLYLRARNLDYSLTNQELQLALLERVTRQAPGFAPAWGNLAISLCDHRVSRPIAEWSEIVADARVAIDRARSLDPKQPDAIEAEFRLLDPYGCFGHQADLLQDLKAEIGNTPNFHVLNAWHLRWIGKMSDAVDALQVARELDPGSVGRNTFHGRGLAMAGRIEEARDALLEELRAAPGNHAVASDLMVCAAYLGDCKLVDELTDPARLERYPLGPMSAYTRLARVDLYGDDDARRQVGETIHARFEQDGRFDLLGAIYLARYLSPSRCHDLIEHFPIGPASREPTASDYNSCAPMLLFIVTNPGIRQDPRFATLCARLGLAQFWSERDIWPDCADSEDFTYDFRAAMKDAARTTPVDPPLMESA